GTFSALTCALAGGSCTVAYTPTSTGNQTLTAAYGGDALHVTSSLASTLSIGSRTTTTTVSCAAPYHINVGSVCTVSVADGDVGTTSTPSGTVTWTTSGTGAFSNAGTCALAAGSCQVTFTPNTIGNQTVTATYGGD